MRRARHGRWIREVSDAWAPSACLAMQRSVSSPACEPSLDAPRRPHARMTCTAKIKAAQPVVELDGDAMARIMWSKLI